MWRAAPSAIETGQNSTLTGPQALTRYEYQSVVPLFPSCSMGERPTAQEAKTENRVEIFLCGNAKGENEFWTSGRLAGSDLCSDDSILQKARRQRFPRPL